MYFVPENVLEPFIDKFFVLLQSPDTNPKQYFDSTVYILSLKVLIIELGVAFSFCPYIELLQVLFYLLFAENL